GDRPERVEEPGRVERQLHVGEHLALARHLAEDLERTPAHGVGLTRPVLRHRCVSRGPCALDCPSMAGPGAGTSAPMALGACRIWSIDAPCQNMSSARSANIQPRGLKCAPVSVMKYKSSSASRKSNHGTPRRSSSCSQRS